MAHIHGVKYRVIDFILEGWPESYEDLHRLKVFDVRVTEVLAIALKRNVIVWRLDLSINIV